LNNSIQNLFTTKSRGCKSDFLKGILQGHTAMSSLFNKKHGLRARKDEAKITNYRG